MGGGKGGGGAYPPEMGSNPTLHGFLIFDLI